MNGKQMKLVLEPSFETTRSTTTCDFHILAKPDK